MESLQNHDFPNEIIDLKNNFKDENSTHKLFKSFNKVTVLAKSSETSITNFNLEL
jgi:hypothetical protein